MSIFNGLASIDPAASNAFIIEDADRVQSSERALRTRGAHAGVA